MQVAERGRTVVSTNALGPPEAPYELIKRASRVYNLNRGNAKIGNRGAMIRAMSDSKHMDACRSDTPFDDDYDATNSNTCCSSADHRAKYFHGLKIAPRPPTRRPREEANCARSVFVLIFCRPTLLTDVCQAGPLPSPLSLK